MNRDDLNERREAFMAKYTWAHRLSTGFFGIPGIGLLLGTENNSAWIAAGVLLAIYVASHIVIEIWSTVANRKLRAEAMAQIAELEQQLAKA